MELLELAIEIERYLNNSSELTNKNTIKDLIEALTAEGMDDL